MPRNRPTVGPKVNHNLGTLRFTSRQTEFSRLINRYKSRPVIVSEGDSWFSYPSELLIIGSGYNIIDHIAKKRRFNILRMENGGDEIRTIMSGRQQKTLRNVLKRFPVDILLFSAGGNDIVGENDLDPLIREKQDGMTWRDCINDNLLDIRIKRIMLDYKELMELRNQSRPSCIIITHTYDYPIANSDGGAEFLWGIIKIKPWIAPTLAKRKITNKADQTKIVRHIFNLFADSLKALHEDSSFVVVDTRNTIKPDDWKDEIHATKNGFKKIANRIYLEIEKYI